MARTRNRNKGSQKANDTSSDDIGATSSFVTPEGVRISEIPLSLPEYGSKPTGRTLLDLIDEKRPRDTDGNPIGFSRKNGDDEEEEEIFGPGMNTFFFAVPLTILLFWLDVLVHMQYRQEVEWRLILMRCLKALPGKPATSIPTDGKVTD
jgi:hypothetical protein